MDGSVAPASGKAEIFRKDYQTPDYTIKSIDLLFDVQANGEVIVTAKSQIERAEGSPPSFPLVLDGSPHFETLLVAIDGQECASTRYLVSPDSLRLTDVPSSFELTIKTKLFPEANTRLEGLYASGGNLCTQCEAEGFRHITYYLDRPDVLAVFSVRIEADKCRYPVLLSNGNPKSEGDLPDNRHFVEWHDPFPKPSYLFALVAGDLNAITDSYTTASGTDVTLNIYVRPADIHLCDHAMASLKRSMKWDEDVYGLEYDLDVYNIVAVSDFNMGAMENKGLNIFNTKYVLADTESATDTDFENVEGVIAHEYFHNWTGNRVTCQDWFQLSLKEGLTVFRDQEFSSDMASRGVKRISDVRVLRAAQFPEDAGPLAHPIRPDSYIEINNFYTATVYNKGAEVIRMMQTLLGRDTFIKGVIHYLKQHDGTAATCEDFVIAMETVSGRSLKQFREWYRQSGTPTVSVTCEKQGDKVSVTCEQATKSTPGQTIKLPFHVPISMAWFDGAGTPINELTTDCSSENDGYLLELTQAKQSFEFSGVPDGATPSYHRAFSAPVKLETEQTAKDYAFLMQHETDAYARWQAAQEIYAGLILSRYHGDDVAVDDANAQLVKHVFHQLLHSLDDDLALHAELLTLPSEIYLAQFVKPLNPIRLYEAHKKSQMDLLAGNEEILHRTYHDLKTRSEGTGQAGVAARKLRNVILQFIAKLDGDGAEEICELHFSSANNMTDQYAGFLSLVNSQWTSRESVIERFYNQWTDNELVIDKWFAAQAIVPGAAALADVKKLVEHQDFSFSNPNRLRSLILSFASANQSGFHSNAGAGYAFLADSIETVDKLNPQTAARMVVPLTRWADLEHEFASSMQNALQGLACGSKLSDDVRELAGKSVG